MEYTAKVTGLSVMVTHHSIVHDVNDHLAARSVSLTMVSSFLLLLEYSLSCGSVFQRKFANDFAEPMNADLTNSRCWMTEKQQEHVKPIKKGIY